jgi:hypothetical protein
MSASSSYGVDTAWYADSAATDHVTGDLDKLNMREKYHGQEQIHTADESGMCISHIGKSILLILANLLFLLLHTTFI